MKKTGFRLFFALFFVLFLTLQLGLGVFAARDAVGDLDGNGDIDKDDAIHLLGSTIFPELYPVDQPVDYNRDGVVDKEDALYLLGHTIFSDLYYICHHEAEKWTEKEVVAPTCNEQGYTVIVCECGEVDKTDFTPANAEAHVWEIADATHAATCLENGYIVKKCSVCELEETIDELAPGHKFVSTSCTEDAVCETCGAVSAAKGHVLGETAVETSEATCTEDGYNVYKCENCDYEYTEITVPKTEHSVADDAWSEQVMRAVEGKECVYVWVETASCSICSETVERVSGEFTYHVEFVAVVDATCNATGMKTISCKVCGETISETEIPVNAEAHTWIAAASEDNAISYECSLCHATKKGITASSDEAVDLGDVDEVTVGGVTIAPDANASEQLAGEEIYISAENHGAGELDNISDELAERIGDDPIYDITIKNGSDDEISSFDGWITVTIPYTLGEGEDPDNIIVWYIDEDGNVTAIEDVEYRSGYAIFKTNHFSKYCVTRMTPEEICDKYGHNYIDSSVPATCASGGYTAERCTRCNDLQVSERFEALGHDWEIVSDTEPTCDKAGETVSVCKRCEITYVATKAALGHDYQPEEDSGKTDRYKEPTCIEPGEHYMVCTKCGDEYAETLACTDHDDIITEVEGDCENGGYTLYLCKACQNAREKGKQLPPGHEYEEGKCKKCLKLCKHDYYYGECKICKSKKNNGNGNGGNEHKHEYVDITLNFGCEFHSVTYTGCSCGEATAISYESSSFQWQSYSQKWVGSCPDCDVHIEEFYTEGERKDCKVEVTNYVVIHNGEETVTYTAERTVEERHDYKSEAKLKDDVSCEGGVTVTYTCVDCGDNYERNYNVHEYYYEEEFDFGCDDHAIVYRACVCGASKNIAVKLYSFNYKMNDDKAIYSCPDCSARVEEYTTYGEKDENCSLTRTYHTDVYNGDDLVRSCTRDGKLVIHSYKETVELVDGATTCEEGVKYTKTCEDCGDTSTKQYNNHYTITTKLCDNGCARHIIKHIACACGEIDDISFGGFSYTHPEENKSIFTCRLCNVHGETYYVDSEKDENCTFTRTNYTNVYDGEELVLSLEEQESVADHTISVSAVLKEGAVTCNDGVIVTETCSECPFVRTYNTSGHVNMTKYVEYGCGNHKLSYEVCPCGYNGSISYNYLMLTSDSDGKKIYICPDSKCDLRVEVVHVEEEKDENCNVAYTDYYTIYCGDEVIEFTDKGVTTRHNIQTTAVLAEGATSCTEGVTIIDNCLDCDYTRTRNYTYHHIVYTVLNEGCENHIVEYGECACGEEYDIHYSGFKIKQEGLKRTYYCDNCDVRGVFNTVRTEKDEFCNFTSTETTEIYVGEELVFDHTDVYYRTVHIPETKLLVDESGEVTNEDGTRTVTETTEMYCEDCLASFTKTQTVSVYNENGVLISRETKYFNYVAVSETETVAVLEREEYYEYSYLALVGYDAPVQRVKHYSYKSWEDGAVSEWSTSDYTFDETNPCLVTHHQVSSWGVDRTETYTEHAMLVNSFVLSEGSTTCVDGVDIIRHCVVCGTQTSRSYYGNGHNISGIPKQVINTKDYGAACNVIFNVYTCPCGASSNVKPSGDADFERKNYYINGHDYYVYTCAVTDPVACGFVWVRETYIEMDDECFPTNYTNYYFGVDVSAKTYKEMLTFESHGTSKNHTERYETVNIDKGYIRTTTCAKCGQLIETFEYVRDGLTVTKTWKYYDNMTGTICTEKNVEINRVVPGISETALLSDYYEYYNPDGSIRSWDKYEYTYPNADKGDYCNRICVHTNSGGLSETTNGTYHLAETWNTVYSNCVEALREYVCLCCGYKRTSLITYNSSHIFIYDSNKGVFVCRVCGLENANGVNGDISFVNVSSEGDGKNYIINYRNWRGDRYTPVLLLYTDGAEEPMLLDDVVMTDDADNRRLYISTAAILDAAAELGLEPCSYTIEIAFVPTTSNDSLVYSFYLDEHIYLVDEENSVFPEDGCDALGGVIITRKCALCGDSYAETHTIHSRKYVDRSVVKTDTEDGGIKIVDTTTYECVYCGETFVNVNERVYSADGLLMYEEERPYSGYFNKHTYVWYDGEQYTAKYECADYTETYEHEFDEDNDVYTETCIRTYPDSSKVYKYANVYQISTGRQLSYYHWNSETDWYKYTYEYYDFGGSVRQYTKSNEYPDYTEVYTYEFNEPEEDQYTVNRVKTYTNGTFDTYTEVRVPDSYDYASWDTVISETREYADGRTYSYTRVKDTANDLETITTIETNSDGNVTEKYIDEYEISTGRQLSKYRWYSETNWYKYTYEWYDFGGRVRQYTKSYERPEYTEVYTYEFNEPEEGQYTVNKVKTYADGTFDTYTIVREYSSYSSPSNDTVISETREYADGSSYSYTRVKDTANDLETRTTIETNSDGIVTYKYIEEYELSTERQLSYYCWNSETDWYKRTYKWYTVNGYTSRYTKSYENATYTEEYEYDFENGIKTITKTPKDGGEITVTESPI